jgi:SAM-dependent methyltransferase
VPSSRQPCPICDSSTDPLTTVRSDFSGIDFEFRQCPSCHLSFVANPRTDFAELYDAEYYAGRGADTFVDYINEMNSDDSVRFYEWQGICRAVSSLVKARPFKWLDYGCGLGGLVRFARQSGMSEVYGFDEGYSADWMTQHGLPVLKESELIEHQGSFDVITAIEVIEHTVDPVGFMKQIATLLKPGGLFFLTTGNAQPHRDQLAKWSYVHPDVHVSYFEPSTLECLYERCNLEPVRAGFVDGYDDIIRYKVLKTLRVKSRNRLEGLVPWSAASRIVDWRHRVTQQPLAVRPITPP